MGRWETPSRRQYQPVRKLNTKNQEDREKNLKGTRIIQKVQKEPQENKEVEERKVLKLDEREIIQLASSPSPSSPSPSLVPAQVPVQVHKSQSSTFFYSSLTIPSLSEVHQPAMGKSNDMKSVAASELQSQRVSEKAVERKVQKVIDKEESSVIDIENYRHPQRIHVHPLTYNGGSGICHLCSQHGPIWFCMPCDFYVCHDCYSQAILEERKKPKKMVPQLAIDLWFYIFQFFAVHDLIKAETICREWRSNIRSSDSNDIWRKSYLAAGLPLSLEIITQVSSWRERTHHRLKIEQNWNHGNCSRPKLLHHGSAVYALAATGKLLATGGPDGILNMWYLDDYYSEGGRFVKTFQGHHMSVTSVAFHPSSGKVGKLIVSGSHDQQVKVWDAMTGVNVLTLKGHKHSVLSVAVSDSRIYSCSSDATINEWDFWTGACVRTYVGHKDQICSIRNSGNRLISGSVDCTLREWDVSTGRQSRLFRGHSEAVTAVHCDETNMYSGSLGGVLKVWENTSGRCKHSISGAHLGTISSIASQGRRLLTGSYDQTIKIWDSEAGNERVCHVGDFGYITSLACREETLIASDLKGDIRFFNHIVPVIG